MPEPPLSGLRIVVTRPEGQAGPLVEGLERLGATAASVPLVEIAPVEDAAALDTVGSAVSRYDWVVFTSANGVRAFGDRLTASGATPRVAVVGPATAEAVRELDVEPAFVGSGVADDIGDGLGELHGARVLLLQADSADPGLVRTLREHGASVDGITAYRTRDRTPSGAEAALLRDADAIVVASGSAARALAALAPVGERALLVCIGPRTAAVAREVGLRVGLVADEATTDGIIRALVTHYRQST